VLGAGAIGSLCAHALQGAGAGVTLLLREKTEDVGSELLVEQGAERSVDRFPVATADDCGSITHLLVTTKAYDVRAAVQSICAHLTDDTVVLLLVNGMGMAEQVLVDHPGLDIYCGTTTEGAYRIAPMHIRHAGRGRTRIGRQGMVAAPAWFENWHRAMAPCQWDPDIEAALWAKLAVNCVINPLTALNDCPNGELASRGELAAEVEALCREVGQVSYAAGFTDTAQNIAEMAAAVIAGTADNLSSMLQDVSAGRRTEVDYITGQLLRVAREHGIAAPHNTALYERIKHIDG
jgi:2-dehydropantoate 2-reductase